MTPDHHPVEPFLTSTDKGLLMRVKVVPGASRSRLVGLIGDHLKIAVTAAAEKGKANQALCIMIGQLLGVPQRDIVIVNGQSQTRKTLAITGISVGEASLKLTPLLTS